MLCFIRKVSLWLAVFLALMPLLTPSPAAAQSSYSVIFLENAFVKGINNAGQVVGVMRSNHAFLYSGGVLSLLPDSAPGQNSSEARSINTSGQIAGYLFDNTGSGTIASALWSGGNRYDQSNGVWDGINDYGEMAGAFDRDNTHGYHLTLWKPTVPNGTTGTKYDLGFFSGDPVRINSYGQIASSHLINSETILAPFFWTPTTKSGTTGKRTTLVGPGGEQWGFAYGINNSGQVIGWSAVDATHLDIGKPSHAFLWTPTTSNGTTGSVIDIGKLPGDVGARPFALNNVGQVVGLSFASPKQSDIHAFVWDTVHGMRDLNTLIPANANILVANTWGINDQGQIACIAYRNGVAHSALLTPIYTSKVSGTITLDGWSGPLNQPLTITVRPQGKSEHIETVTLDSSGHFTLNNVEMSQVTLHIKGSKWLAKNVAVDASKGDVSGVTATLLGGDVNNDNVVGLDDLGLLADAFDTKPGDALWNDAADLNGDGVVGLDDLGLLAFNFDTAGDP